MDKMYRVIVAFEGRRRNTMFTAEPSPRLDALVSGGYLKVYGEVLDDNGEEAYRVLVAAADDITDDVVKGSGVAIEPKKLASVRRSTRE